MLNNLWRFERKSFRANIETSAAKNRRSIRVSLFISLEKFVALDSSAFLYRRSDVVLGPSSILSHMSRKVRKCVHTVRVKAVLLLPKLDFILGLKRIAC